MENLDQKEKVMAAFINLRRDLNQPKKDQENPYFNSKYTNLDSVIKAIDDASFGKEYGLTFSQEPITKNEPVKQAGVATYIFHNSGQYLKYDPLLLPVVKSGKGGSVKEPDMQTYGSVITYSRRYSLSAILGIASEPDDDGNAAVGNYQNQNNVNKISPQLIGELKTNLLLLSKAVNMKVDDLVKQYKVGVNTINEISNLDQEMGAKLLQMVKKNLKEQENKAPKANTNDPFARGVS